jgi:hypothetical protein
LPFSDKRLRTAEKRNAHKGDDQNSFHSRRFGVVGQQSTAGTWIP